MEFGLACSCLSPEVYNMIKTQTILNAGIHEESGRKEGGNECCSATSFMPVNLVKCLEAVAQCPYGGVDKLEFTIARAQLLAFTRWKGCYELPEFEMFDGLSEDVAGFCMSMEINDSEGAIEDVSWTSEVTARVSLRKKKPVTRYIEEEIRLSDSKSGSLSNLSSGNIEAEGEAGRRSTSFPAKKRKIGDSMSDICFPKERNDSEGGIEDVSRIREGTTRVSLRKRKPVTRYIEEEICWSDLKSGSPSILSSGNAEAEGEAGRSSSSSAKKRKIGESMPDVCMSKEINDSEGAIEDVNQISEVTTRVSLRKKKPVTRYIEEEVRLSDLKSGSLSNLSIGNTEAEGGAGRRSTSSSAKKCKNADSMSDVCMSKEINDSDRVIEDVSRIPEGTTRVSLQKKAPVSHYNKEEIRLSDLASGSLSNLSSENTEAEGEAGRSTLSSAKKRGIGDSMSGAVKNRRTSPVGKDGSKKTIGEKGSNKGPFGKSSEKRRKITRPEFPPPDGMLLQLHIAAREPTKGCSTSLINFFSNYRNSLCLEISTSQGPKRSSGKVSIAKKSSTSKTTETSEFEGMKDSYWTDRLKKGDLKEQVIYEPDTIPKDTNDPGFIDENFEEEYTPTAVILFFADVESVPSKSDMHHLFGCYGPLNKSNTEVVKKSRRARVVFKRRSDAENAFTSTGRFSIFGPKLVSYRLSYFYPE